jgi:hypothetical protein
MKNRLGSTIFTTFSRDITTDTLSKILSDLRTTYNNNRYILNGLSKAKIALSNDEDKLDNIFCY